MHLGAAVDVVGLRIDQVPRVLIDAIVAEYPRHAMKIGFAAVIAAEAETKPYSTAAALVRDLNFLDLIGASPFAE